MTDTRSKETTSDRSAPSTGWSNLIIGLALGIGILGILGAPLNLWSRDGWQLIPSKTLALGGALLLGGLGVVLARGRPAQLVPTSVGGGLILLLLFISDWLTHGYNLFQGPSIRGEIILLGALMWWVLRRSALGVLNLVALLAPLGIAITFFNVADGRLIFSDDHPVFLFRLISLKENFPFIPFYNPLWNGGIDARDFFATGALNVFLPFWPIIRLFDVTAVYNYIVVGVVFILGPAATFLAARLERSPKQPNGPSPAIAALLHLTVSLLWFRWGLKYGTMGFVTAASLVPLNIVLAGIILSPDRPLSRRLMWLSLITMSLMLCWSLAGLVFIPCIVLALCLVRRLWRKENVIRLAILLLVINLPWMALFWSVSNVGRFVHAEKKVQAVAPATTDGAVAATKTSAPPPEPRAFRGKAKGVSLKESLKVLRESAVSTNPLLLAFAIPGLFLLGKRNRLVFGVTAVWLLTLGAIAAPMKPQLELDRMLLMLALLGAIPASLAITALFERAAGPGRGIVPRALAALTGGFLLTGPFIVSGVLHNRTVEHFHFAEPIVAEMSSAITQFGGAGRVLYSGFVLHELSNGHLAPLVYMTGKPLIASSYAHDKWRYEQVFPASFIGAKDPGIRRYLDLYNVSAVFAHERAWRDYFRARPTEFDEVWRGDRFSLFTRLGVTPTYLLEGSGEVLAQRSNGVVFRLATPDAVLKFNYFPFLRADGCTVTPAPIEGGLTFVRLSGCPTDRELTLQSVDPITRFVRHE